PHSHLRSACRWCLQQWGQSLSPEAPTGPLRDAAANWYINPSGQTMVVLHPPGRLLMGCPSWYPGWSGNVTQHYRTLPRTFAMSSTEVTAAEFDEFYRDPKVVKAYVRSKTVPIRASGPSEQNHPQVSIDYRGALRFCQWLSEKEGIPPDQWCYPGIWEATESSYGSYQVPTNFLSRTGYRLPTEAEWEYACRAGSRSAWHFGDTQELATSYGWHTENANAARHPVAKLKPNEYGFFDLLGNVKEWSHDEFRLWYIPPAPSELRVLDGTVARTTRGNSYAELATIPGTYARPRIKAEDHTGNLGFRVARTMPH
ncbi:MAG TPA: formylglycine-generating enzyme family protein, partial [Pirellulaceae bacterium]